MPGIKHPEGWSLVVMAKIITIMSFAIISGTIGFWMFDRQPCYTIIDGRAVPNPARPNDELDLELTVEVNKSGCTGYFVREIVDSAGWVWTSRREPISFNVLKVGRHKTHSQIAFALPKGIALGDAIVRSHVWFVRNPLSEWWPIHYVTPDRHFVVEGN